MQSPRSTPPRFPALRAMMLGGAIVALAAGVLVGQPAPDPAAPLGGAERWLTHVSTDKPMYREGETVYLRAVVLEAHRHTPLAQGTWAQAVIEIVGPKGETVATLSTEAQDSVAGAAWAVPAGQAGGAYVARVTWPMNGWPTSERSFDVRAYRAPRLKTQIVFVKDGYGPGEQVQATAHVDRPEGGSPVGARVVVVARVDGAEVHRATATLDAAGNVAAAFALPKIIERGEGTLAVTITDGGVVETATKTLPILLQTVDLQLFPEGGDLVAGLPCRVYFEGRLPNGKPADMDGVVNDSTGREVARFASDHDGRGRFGFVPAPGEPYTLQVVRPAGITRTWELPAVKKEGAVISADADVTPPGEPVRVTVGSSRGGELIVTLSKREVEVGRATVRVGAGEVHPISLAAAADVDGVLVATVWDGNGLPLAERLVMRQPQSPLTLTVEADRDRYVPGGSVELTVKARDAAGKPVSAVVGLTVTDDSVLESMDKRDQAPRLPVMVLLEPEVRELADAHVYLDPTNPKADVAVDRLLGTQGWRRFAFVDPVTFAHANGDAGRRVVALVEPTIQPSKSIVLEEFGGVAGQGMAPFAAGAPAPPDEPAEPEAAPQPDMPKVAEAPVAAAEQQPQGGDEAVDVLAAQDPAPQHDSQKRAEPVLRMREKNIAAGEAKAARDWRGDDGDEAFGGGEEWVTVREYAHAVRPNRRAGERVDFTETLYWAAGVRTDPSTGEAKVSFGLSDSVTGFRVLADGFTDAGALGAGTALIESVEPFNADVKLPLFATQGDLVRLPVALTNGTDAALEGARVTVSVPDGATISQPPAMTLGPASGARHLVDMEITKTAGALAVTVDATAGTYADRVTRELVIEPNGFPQEVGFGGLLEPGKPMTREVTITPGLVVGSVVTRLAVQPSPLASLTSAFERLIQEPYGCFEQTSSSTFPLVMAQQYFTTHQGVDPAIVKRSAELLDKGHDRLRGFECKERGYEWFGEDPGHEALTAYGLLEFTEMSRVREVDPDMLARTRAWLLGHRDGKGGFERKRRALHTWIEDRDASNAYITYALVATGGPEGLKDELLSVEDAAHGSSDSYVIGLAANATQLGGRGDAVKPLLDKLAKAQQKDGSVSGGKHSIVGSQGDALLIETTALATMAWLRSPAHQDNVEVAIRWLADACKGGRYGSTQSTVLALQAIVAYDASRAQPKAPGTLRLLVDGALVGAVPFDGTSKGALELPGFAEQLTAGRHTITVEMEGGSSMPITGAVTWTDASPASSPACAVTLKTRLRDATLREGGVTEIEVTVSNPTKDPVPMPIAIIGLPGGLEPRHDQLKELAKAGTIAAYEVRGRDVVLYWRDMGAGKAVTLPLSLVAAIPGTWTGPASRAYLYYTDEHKTWTPGARVTITPQEG